MNLENRSSTTNLILIVDDTPANLRVLSEALTAGGYEVAVATNGEQALKQCQYTLPDLILLDVQMPGIDGFETCSRLKQNSATIDIPVIFMTALSETESKVKGLNVGAVDYITKPFQHEEVLARVKVHLQIRNLTKQLETKNLLLQQFNDNLEERVVERTTSLQQAQLQLVQQEKLSALGQLVAGVAHEINNPVNFIYGNLSHAQRYIQELLEVIDLYQEYCPNAPAILQEKVADIDLPFVKKDLIKLLESMRIGADRIREIVLSLRNFSRLDEAAFKSVDLHEGIENSLMILQHRIKSKSERPEIELTKNYGQLPLVDCFPGQLNQVFMNLLANAIDALDERDQTRTQDQMSAMPSAIEIQTEVVDAEWVRIRVQDNGAGIPETVQRKIFDPFFTTKPVGKGTGLGLSISHQIVVDRHGGKITCRSAPNSGTEFVIEIPIRQTVDETTGDRVLQEVPMS